uniref:DMRT like family B with proline rich C-terminal 1 n=1 Tax=Phocoena sinus TaxID=42100 RepID=A0A8C9DWC7_PHOSS
MLRAPRCSRCRNHGFLVPVKGHAGKCRWKQCTCKKCYLITQRQKITAAQQVLQKQVSEEEQEVALCAQGPQLASGDTAAVPGSSLRPLPPPAASGDAHPGPERRAAACFLERPQQGWSPGPSTFQPVLGGRGHVGPSKQAAAAMPSSLRPQLGAEAAGRGCPSRLELSRPLRPVLSPPFADFGPPLSVNSDRVVGSEYLEREPSKLYHNCSSVHPYHPFLLGYQDASLTPRVPLQQGFQHVSCSHYNGAGLVSTIPDSSRFLLTPVTLAAFTDPQSQEASHCAHSVPGPGHWSEGYSIDLVLCTPLGMHMCSQVCTHVDKSAWAVAWVKRLRGEPPHSNTE